jgi:hypothetical protein
LGQAADIEVEEYTDRSIALTIAHDFSFDQVILEFGWVHVSYVSRELNRKQILTAYMDKGRTKYREGIV